MNNAALLKLVLGSALANFIFLLISPKVLSFYGASEYSHYAEYIAWVAILTIGLSLRQETFLVYYETKVEQKAIIYKIFRKLFNYLIASGPLFFLALYYDVINVNEDNWEFPLLVLFGAMFNVVNLSSIQLSIIEKKAFLTVIIRNGPILLLSIFILFAIMLKIQLGMIIVYLDLASKAIILFIGLIINRRWIQIKNPLNRDREIKRSVFPQEILTALLGVLLYNIPFIILPLWLDPHFTGYLFLSFRVSMAIVSLLGTALNDVVKKNLWDTKVRLGEVAYKTAHKSLTKKLFMFSVVYLVIGLLIINIMQLYMKNHMIILTTIGIFLPASAFRLMSATLAFSAQLERNLTSTAINYAVGCSLLTIGILAVRTLNLGLNFYSIVISCAYAFFSFVSVIISYRVVHAK